MIVHGPRCTQGAERSSSPAFVELWLYSSDTHPHQGLILFLERPGHSNCSHNLHRGLTGNQNSIYTHIPLADKYMVRKKQRQGLTKRLTISEIRRQPDTEGVEACAPQS